MKAMFPSFFCWAITILAVIIAWVPFRATTFDGTIIFWSSMIGQNEIGLPATVLGFLNIQPSPESSWHFLFQGTDILELQDWVFVGIPLIIGAGLTALYLPNSQQLASYFQIKLEKTISNNNLMVKFYALILSLVFLVSMSRLNSASEFMYFQF